MKCYPPHVLQDISGVTHHLQPLNRVMRQEQSRPCPISNLGEVPRLIYGWRCQEELHPKTPEPLLVSPTKATTGMRWASPGGSIAPAATREWRAWFPNSLAPSRSCVSPKSKCLLLLHLRLGVDGGSLRAQAQSPPLLSDWSLLDGTWIAR